MFLCKFIHKKSEKIFSFLFFLLFTFVIMLIVTFVGTTGALMACAFVVDLIVWYKADKINFGNEEPIPATQEEELTPITEKSCFETTKN